MELDVRGLTGPASHTLYLLGRDVKQFVLYLHEMTSNLALQLTLREQNAKGFCKTCRFSQAAPTIQITEFQAWTASRSTSS